MLGESDRRERRYFALTRVGLPMLRGSRRRFVRLWDALGPLLEKSR